MNNLFQYLVIAVLLSLAGCSSEDSVSHNSPANGASANTGAVSSGVRSKAAGTLAEQAARAQWGAPVALSIVPAAAASLPDGRVVFWSAEDRFSFNFDFTMREDQGRTYTVLYDHATGSLTERLVGETRHNMFCPGTTNLADGRLMVTGGLSTVRTSIFDAASNNWSESSPMNIPRGYQANTILGDGSVFTLGGSWSGGLGNKHGEIWTAASGWRRLSGVAVDPFLTPDPTSDYSMDSHFWLLPSGNGRILHAGPGREMHWIDPRGEGQVNAAGPRGDDGFSQSGNAVMYDYGRILKVGGASGYDNSPASTASFVIDTRSGAAAARRIQSMTYPRAFGNSVVLPNGQVVVVGGMTYARAFSDANAVLVPELFDPATETFTQLPPISVPRNYHSVALLLPDGRVISGGGGLCGEWCGANHPNFQILSPPYLFNADGSLATRPVITQAPRTAIYGTTITVAADQPIDAMSIVRLGSSTHTVNNDQRRLPLQFSALGGNRYAVVIPDNTGWALPGEYMLFAMNADGTPSVSASLRIGARDGLWLTPPGDQYGSVGTPVELYLQARAQGGPALRFAASGLPDGLTIDPSNGRVSGVPSRAGSFLVTLRVSSGDQSQSWEVPWTIGDSGNVRYVRFESLDEVLGNAWAAIAEFDLYDNQGRLLPRTSWTVSASSEETVGGPGAAQNAMDGNGASIWHSRWFGSVAQHPHNFYIDLGGSQQIGGFRYTPPAGAGSGSIGRYRLYFSADAQNWGAPVASGDFRELGGADQPKSVFLTNLVVGRPAAQSSTGMGGAAIASRAADGSTSGDPNGGSVSLTNVETNPWWEVDLGSNHTLHSIRIWNRSDCCAEQLGNFTILISANPMAGRSLAALLADPGVRSIAFPGQAGPMATINGMASGRYLRVQHNGTAALQLAEVQAFGYPSVNRAPIIATPVAPVTRAGVATSLQLSGSDADGDALNWSAVGLPAGLNLDAARGLITGTPSAPGTQTVRVSVSDGNGGNADTTFQWSVLAQELTVSPVASPAVAISGVASYAADATGTGLQFRWDFGDGTGPTAFSPNPNVNHVFRLPGIYTVTLSVRDVVGTVVTRSFMQAVVTAGVGQQAAASGPIAFERRNGSNSRVWVVNPDNGSVTVMDALSLARIAEITVGSQPRSVALGGNGRVWISNRDDASLTLIDATSLAVLQTVLLTSGSQPYGVVAAPDGGAIVALEALGQVARVSPQGQISAVAAVPGARHLSLAPNGTRLLVSRFVTAPQPGESTAQVRDNVNGSPAGGEVIELDINTLGTTRRFVLRHSDRADSAVSGRGVPNYLGAAAISPDGTSAWIPSKQDNLMRGTLRDGQNLDFQSTVRAISSRIDLGSGVEDYAGRVDHDNSSVASAAVFHPAGAYVLVALESSRQVAVLDAYGRRELFRFDTGRAPQGLVVSADGRRLYVHNFMDRTIGAFDLSSLVDYGQPQVTLLATPATITAERLAPDVLRGKQFFYDARDPRLARDQYMSCASCHNDGGHDGRVWDMTGFGEGLRNTPPLRGRGARGFGLLHASGNFDEVQDFEGQIRALAGGSGLVPDSQYFSGTRRQPLGDRLTGVNGDLDALAAYVNSLVQMPISPYRNPQRGLTTTAAEGRQLFQSLGCASCHGGTQFTISNDTSGLRDIGTITPSSGNRLGGPLRALDVPNLRDTWSSAPYLHNGSAATISDAIGAHNLYALRSADIDRIAQFIRETGAEEPVPEAYGAGAGTPCAQQGGLCAIPAGAIATVDYVAQGGAFLSRSGVTGGIECSSGAFGDPGVGLAKSCSYRVTQAPGSGGSNVGNTGSGNTSGTGSGSNGGGTPVVTANNGTGGTTTTVPGFTFVSAASPLNVASTGNTEAELELVFGSSSSGPVTFSCANLPANTRCAFQPATVLPDADGRARTRVVFTTGISPMAALGGSISGIALGAVLLGGLGGQRHRRAANRRRWIVLALTSLAMIGCGGGGGGGGSGVPAGDGASQAARPTPAGNYTVTIVASDGKVTRSIEYSLTVR